MIRTNNEKDKKARRLFLAHIDKKRKIQVKRVYEKIARGEVPKCICPFNDCFADLSDEQLKGVIKLVGRALETQTYNCPQLESLIMHALEEKFLRTKDFPEVIAADSENIN